MNYLDTLAVVCTVLSLWSMPSLEYSLSGSTDVQTAVVDAPKTKATCGILLGHGAGGDSNSGHLPKIAQAFCDAGILCVRFNCKPPNLAKRVAHAEVRAHHQTFV